MRHQNEALVRTEYCNTRIKLRDMPTAGSAKKFNGLETSSFFRRTSLVKYSQTALKRDAEIIARFGAMEMLDAHGRAGTIRFKKP